MIEPAPTRLPRSAAATATGREGGGSFLFALAVFFGTTTVALIWILWQRTAGVAPPADRGAGVEAQAGEAGGEDAVEAGARAGRPSGSGGAGQAAGESERPVGEAEAGGAERVPRAPGGGATPGGGPERGDDGRGGGDDSSVGPSGAELAGDGARADQSERGALSDDGQERRAFTDATPRDVTPSRGLLPGEELLIDLYRESVRSVVHVTRLFGVRNARNTALLASAGGSGFIWDDEGHIVTNLHLIKEVRGVVVTLSNGLSYNAAFVGASPQYDLAVLRISAPAALLKPIPLGSSSDLRVGQSVLAIGSPLGLDQSLATGIISGLDRRTRLQGTGDLTGMIQIDATINVGNSGGPLLDSSGRLIGINTSMPAASTSSSGVGFAIPADTINQIVPRIIREGQVPWPDLGAHLASDLDASVQGLQGVLIVEVGKDSPAEAAGLRSWTMGGTRLLTYDLIIGIDGRAVTGRADFDRVMLDKRAGDEIALDIRREDGSEHRVFVTLGARGEELEGEIER